MTENPQPAVSVVVPVCNVENYVCQAIDSLLAQTLSVGQLEIICIDDGSTDSSAEILEEYARTAERDNRKQHLLKVVNLPENRGYGHAMNTGLSLARGQFIGFLEPDDFVDDDGFAALLAVAREHGADLVKANYFDHREGETLPDRLEEALRGYPYGVPLCVADDDTLPLIRPCVWSALYRRDLIEENGLRFNETPGASYQDTGFAFEAIACAKHLVLVPDAYVHYRLDNTSSSTHSTGKEFCVYDEISMLEAFVNSDAERRRALSPVLVYKSFWLHDWNRRRLGDCDAMRVADALMSAKLQRAAAEGTLQRRFFNAAEWETVEHLLRLDAVDVEDLANREREKVVAEYEGSWSYRIGRGILRPLRALASLRR